jgi:hypothetical protein
MTKVIIAKRKLLNEDDVEDDWSDKGEAARDDDNSDNTKRKPVKHLFEVATDRIARERGMPKYLASAHARKENPGSFKHYQQQGSVSSRPRIKKEAPLDDVDVCAAWSAAIDAHVAGYGTSRTEAMSILRKTAPALWRQRFRK